MSIPQLRASFGRTALVVGGVATGVALIVAINIINTSVLANFRQTIELIAGPAALEVTLGVGEVGFPESTVGAVTDDPDVVVAVPLVRGTIALASDPADTLQLFGADFMAEADLQRYSVRTETSRRELVRTMEDPRSVLLTTGFARAAGVDVGDKLAFSVPDGVVDLTVRGLLEPEGMAAAFGGQLAVMDLPAAQMLLGKDQLIDQIDIVLQDGADVLAVQARLDATLPAVLRVVRPVQRGRQYEGVLASFQAMLTGLSTLCLVTGLFIIFNTTSTAAIQRGTAMGRLRLIGAEPARLFRLLMLEAGLLGAVGAVVGIAIGIPLAWLLSGTITGSMGVIFQLDFTTQQLAVDSSQLTLIALTGVLVSLFASFFAARRLAQLDPLEAARAGLPAHADQQQPRPLLRWWAVLLGCSAVAFFLEHELKSIAWGNFGSTLWNASVIVVAIPVVEQLARPLSRLLPRWFGAGGSVAAGSMFRASARTGVTVAAIGLTMAVAILLSSLVLSCRESLRSYFGGFLAADLVVSAMSTEGGWLETPLPDRVGDELRKIPGVRSASLARVVSGQPFGEHRIGILALDDDAFAPARAPEGWYREGNATDAGRAIVAGEGASVSVSLSDRFGVHLGDRLELESPTGLVTLPVVGVVPDYVSDRGSVILSRHLLAERWEDRTINRAHLFLEPGADPAGVRERIKTRLGDRYRLKILSLGELLDYHTDLIDRAFAPMNSVQLLIIIVTIAGIFDLLLARILERRRELALWRIVGADDAAVQRSVVVESATIGAIGAALGIAVGVVTAWIWIGVHFRQLLGYYVEYHFALGATLWYVVLVLMTTMLAGRAAAAQATRQSVLQGIQTE